MRHIIGITGVAASLVLAYVAAHMNYRFGYQLGRTPEDGQLYGTAAVAAGVLFFISFFFILSSFQARRWGQALASLAVLVVCGAYGLSSALGHAALNRLDRSGAREAVKVQHVSLEDDLKRAKSELAFQPQARGMPVVAAEMTALKTRALWTWSEECKKPDNNAQRNFCRRYFELEREFGAAAERRRLETSISDINQRIASNTAAGGGGIIKASDPQSYAIAETGHLLGYDVRAETVALILMLLVPLMLEIGSSGGLYAALGMWGVGHNLAPPRRERPAPIEPPMRAPRRAPLPVPRYALTSEAVEMTERTRAMLSVFWARHMRPIAALSTPAGTAYEHYRDICLAEGETPASREAFLKAAEPYVRLRTHAGGDWMLHGVTPVRA